MTRTLPHSLVSGFLQAALWLSRVRLVTMAAAVLYALVGWSASAAAASAAAAAASIAALAASCAAAAAC